MALTQDGRHAFCNGGCKKAIAIDASQFVEWEEIEMQDGPPAHLCPRCRGRRDRGISLSLDYVLECFRCGRNTQDNPEVKEWRSVPGPPGGDPTGPGPLGDRPKPVTVCEDCWDIAEDWPRP